MTDPFMISDLKETVVRYGESGSLVDHSSPFGYRAVDPAERYAVDHGCKWGGRKCLECGLPECVYYLQDRHPGRSKERLVREMKR